MYTIALIVYTLAAAVSTQTLQPVLENQSDTLSSFTQYVTDAGLLDTINGMGDVTIFAPTNEAFQAVLRIYPDLVNTNDSGDSNSTPISDRLMNILQYHVVPGAVHELQDFLPYPGSFYPTAYNGIVVNPYVTADNGSAVYSAQKRLSHVNAADITFDTGIIHTLDKVLLPPTNANVTAHDMGFVYFYGALQQTELVSDLVSADQVTLFIPTDQAFINVGSALQDISAPDFNTIIAFHAVVDNVLYTINLSDSDSLNSLANTAYEANIDISVNEGDGALYANNARVITPNILLQNGVAHLIDQVFNPATEEDNAWTYDLNEDAGEGVPAFEDAASATIPALTSSISPLPTSTYSPTATFSAVSGAENSYKQNRFLASLCAAGLGLLFV